MEPVQGDHGKATGGGDLSSIDGRAPCVRAFRVWPLVALAFTTISLATSAFRVVASSIGSAEQTWTGVSAAAFTCPDRKPSGSVCDPKIASIEPSDRSEPDEPPALPVPASTILPPPPRPSLSPVGPPPRPVSVAAVKAVQPPRPIPVATTTKSVRPPGVSSKPIDSVAPRLEKPRSDARRIMVRDGSGNRLVSRVYGQEGDRVAVLLPDGSIGWPDGLTYTEAPFVPETIPELDQRLRSKEFAGFQSVQTRHYLVLYKGSKTFAQNSAAMLETLYSHLTSLFNKRKVPVHDAEFPLVAIIFENEEAFRRHQYVGSDVQAYYEILSNRIFLYEHSKRDLTAPEVSALQKPQTVAHEGTHQILQNIGVQPRLSNWPLWLVEGLAEYCATPKVGKNGVAVWAGLGQPNLPHLVTIRDLDDPLSAQVLGERGPKLHRDPGVTLVEYIVTRTQLSPTDYALAWAVTHHLAVKRGDEFLDFIREMSALPPLKRREPQDNLRAFRDAFGDNLTKLDAAVLNHVRKIKQIDALPYFAVVFQQQVGPTVTRRAMVSQSQAMVRQFLEQSTSPRGGEPHWQVVPHPTRARALITAHQWVGGG
jgi:hypothetical protein